MNYRVIYLSLLAILYALVPCYQAVAADNYEFQCKKGSAVRVIRVLYPSGNELPCEVHYVKEGGIEQTLWRYEITQGVCESKAQAFVEQQHGWGWDCKQSTAGTVTLPQSTPKPPKAKAGTTMDSDVLDATANQGKESHKQ